jgi:RNA polymerase primary sigma factor
MAEKTTGTDKIEETVKLLVEEGRKKGVLSYTEMNRLLEDQFVPPDKMDAIFLALEDSGVEMVDDEALAAREGAAEDVEASAAAEPEDGMREDDLPEALLPRAGLPEKIDDPVRMYLTQMGEIPLLTRDQEIYLAKTIEITRKRFRKKAMGSGLALRAALRTLEEVERGELASRARNAPNGSRSSRACAGSS